MDNAALRLAELLDQPVKIWMLLAVCCLTRLIAACARLIRARVHRKDVVTGIAERTRAYQTARLKQEPDGLHVPIRRNIDSD